MKWMIASDIHGSAAWCEKVLERFREEKAARLLLLGDLLYHGPRNALPDGYDPPKTAALLNGLKDRILCVRGNCEAEVDQMMLEFPVMADYALMALGDRNIYITHGHLAGEKNPPVHVRGDILLCGHTHVPKCAEYDTFVYMNPGSAAIPKEDSPNSYMTLEDGAFLWKRLESGEAWMSYQA